MPWIQACTGLTFLHRVMSVRWATSAEPCWYNKPTFSTLLLLIRAGGCVSAAGPGIKRLVIKKTYLQGEARSTNAGKGGPILFWVKLQDEYILTFDCAGAPSKRDGCSVKIQIIRSLLFIYLMVFHLFVYSSFISNRFHPVSWTVV